ncbi:MAG TPA: YraN family protein [Terracidiphilus sp.]|nr:YraN family protein [Terracidiphilus sp.]
MGSMTLGQRLSLNLLEGAVARLDRLAARLGRKPDLAPHLQTGIAGEEAAYFYLLRKGYIVVARRWAPAAIPGDLDLIAWQGPMLCFVEVKTRTAHDIAPAESNVDHQKRRVMRRLARRYIRQLPQPLPPPVRFDVVSVYLIPGTQPEFTHFEAAFGWSENRRDWD